VASSFSHSAEFIWLTLFLGMGVALAEWRLTKNSDDTWIGGPQQTQGDQYAQ
jgi:hypothetical protein